MKVSGMRLVMYKEFVSVIAEEFIGSKTEEKE